MKKWPFILILFVVRTYGQQSVVPLDVSSNMHCDDYLARIDNFFVALHKDPHARGYVVISGDKERLRRKLAYELWFKGAVNFRRFNQTDAQVIRGEEKGEPTVTFWVVPTGSDFAPPPSVTWDFALPTDAKPFVFHDDTEQICGSPGFEVALKEYLAANPTAITNVVVFARNRKMYARGLDEAKRNLQSIERKRINYFYKNTETRYPWAEYWIIAKKRR